MSIRFRETVFSNTLYRHHEKNQLSKRIRNQDVKFKPKLLSQINKELIDRL